ncbi:MAG: transketolase [Candidatus Latescibacterota bacterium]|nr:MAG: transketolase [Candidatus Latescibacterota bacterium]
MNAPDKRSVDELCINTIRTLSMDAVQRANSGHPGAPMGMAPLAYVLYDRFLRFNPGNPEWANRDRFVLSAGHASMLLYSVLHITGYDISLDDIKNFRQLHGKCAGHPEFGLAPGVETTTGPLGQGAGNSVGMAMAERWLEGFFNRPGHNIIDYNVFAVLGDGCMMEGISSEAASLAGHLGLGNLVWIYDNNHITIEGSTSLAWSDDVAARFASYHWHVQHVKDVNDLDALSRALEAAIDKRDKPSLVIADSHIAFGSPKKQDTASAHGEPLGDEEIAAAKRNYGWDPDKSFYVPDEVIDYRDQTITRGRQLQEDWDNAFAAYAQELPKLAKQFEIIQSRHLPIGWDTDILAFPADKKGLATRAANGKILNAVATHIPWLIGGSADLAPSNKTVIDGSPSFQKSRYDARNIHFGIREHAMGAVLNGMSLSKLRPYGATFLVFSDYLRPALRLSALMNQPVVYIFTHDSIAVGEDGPTHQPVEHIASLRAIPNLDVIRPADANELAALWRHLMTVNDRPVALVLSRQSIPVIDRDRYAAADGALRGAYVLADCDGEPDIILLATGAEVQICLDAYDVLSSEGIRPRVVSMPCWSLFERQDDTYRDDVLPPEVKTRLAVEAGSMLGWERYTGGTTGRSILGLGDFGASAPARDLLEEFGLTVENVVTMAKQTIDRYRS